MGVPYYVENPKRDPSLENCPYGHYEVYAIFKVIDLEISPAPLLGPSL